MPHLEQLFGRLRKSGLVVSIRGPGVGNELGVADFQISIAQIIAAVDEGVDGTLRGGKVNCSASEMCLTHALLHELGNEICKFLSEISLAD